MCFPPPSSSSARWSDHAQLQLASSEAKENLKAKPASQRVSQMLNLRNVVAQVPVLKKALEGCRSTLLGILCEVSLSALIEELAPFLNVLASCR